MLVAPAARPTPAKLPAPTARPAPGVADFAFLDFPPAGVEWAFRGLRATFRLPRPALLEVVEPPQAGWLGILLITEGVTKKKTIEACSVPGVLQVQLRLSVLRCPPEVFHPLLPVLPRRAEYHRPKLVHPPVCHVLHLSMCGTV